MGKKVSVQSKVSKTGFLKLIKNDKKFLMKDLTQMKEAFESNNNWLSDQFAIDYVAFIFGSAGLKNVLYK